MKTIYESHRRCHCIVGCTSHSQYPTTMASSGAMKLTLAATVATAAASLAYASAFGVSRRRSSSTSCISNIPPEILQSDCREEVILAVRLALEGKLCGFLCC